MQQYRLPNLTRFQRIVLVASLLLMTVLTGFYVGEEFVSGPAQPTSVQKPLCDYLIYPNASMVPVTYLANNCQTNTVDFSSTNATALIVQTMQNLPRDLNGVGERQRIIAMKGNFILGGGTIGCYSHPSNACIPSHTTFELTNANITQVAGCTTSRCPGGLFTVVSPTATPLYSDVLIRGGIINLNGNVQHGILICGYNRVTVDGTEVTNSNGNSGNSAYGIYLAGDTQDVTIQNTIVHHISAAGIASDQACTQQYQGAIFAKQGNVNVHILNNRVYDWDVYSTPNNHNGIHSEGDILDSGNYTTRSEISWVISGNIVGPTSGSSLVVGGQCIYVGSQTRSLITNNYLLQCNSQGIDVVHSDHVSVTNNYVYQNGVRPADPSQRSGITVEGQYISSCNPPNPYPCDYGSSNILVSNNYVYNNPGTAITGQQSENFNVIVNNLLTGNGSNSVVMTGSSDIHSPNYCDIQTC